LPARSAATKNGQDLINIFSPDCQKQVKVADVNAGLAKLTASFPKLKGTKVDDVDFGNKVSVKKDGTGYIVTVPGTKDFKVKVSGHPERPDWAVARPGDRQRRRRQRGLDVVVVNG